MEFVRHLGKKLLFPVLPYAVWIGHSGPTEKLLLNLPKGEIILWGSCFHKRFFQTFCRTQKKTIDELCIRHLQISCFMEKSARHH